MAALVWVFSFQSQFVLLLYKIPRWRLPQKYLNLRTLVTLLVPVQVDEFGA
jgi:hypothetical protein